MQTIQKERRDGLRGLYFVVRLISDALFTAGTVLVGLLAGAYLGTTLLGI